MNQQNHSLLYSDILENDSNESSFQPNFFIDVQIENIFGNLSAKKKWQTETSSVQLQSHHHVQKVESLSNLTSPYIDPILHHKGTFQFV